MTYTPCCPSQFRLSSKVSRNESGQHDCLAEQLLRSRQSGDTSILTLGALSRISRSTMSAVS